MTENERQKIKDFIASVVDFHAETFTPRLFVFVLWCAAGFVAAVGTLVGLLDAGKHADRLLAHWLSVDAVWAAFYPAIIISFGLIAGTNRALLVARRKTPKALDKKIKTSQNTIAQLEAELELDVDTPSYP